MVGSPQNEVDLVESDEGENDELDPQADTPKSRKLFTQPYDLTLKTLVDQIKGGTLHVRPLSDKPFFQRRSVWPDTFASRLIESILLNVPVPPCFLAQNDDFELEVIDGQQRIFSIYRFIDNQFTLSGLEALIELNGKKFFQLEKLQNKLSNHTLRCVVITNDSDEELRFDVFQRLNSNTVPLNAQELRNCVYRGSLVDLVQKLVYYKPWLKILRRSEPDRRMKADELVLRFFAFQNKGVKEYRTPQKYWLNDVAKDGQQLSAERMLTLEELWNTTIDNCLKLFSADACFRRPLAGKKSAPLNKALFDLQMWSLSHRSSNIIIANKELFQSLYVELFNNEEFVDLISKSVDHKSRTLRRFEIWSNHFAVIS